VDPNSAAGIKELMRELMPDYRKVDRGSIPTRPVGRPRLSKEDLIGVALGSLISAGVGALSGEGGADSARMAARSALVSGASGVALTLKDKEAKEAEERKTAEREWEHELTAQDRAQQRDLQGIGIASQIQHQGNVERIANRKVEKELKSIAETNKALLDPGSGIPPEMAKAILALPEELRPKALADMVHATAAESVKPKTEFGLPFFHDESGSWVQRDFRTGRLIPIHKTPEPKPGYSIRIKRDATGRVIDTVELPKGKANPKGFLHATQSEEAGTKRAVAPPVAPTRHSYWNKTGEERVFYHGKGASPEEVEAAIEAQGGDPGEWTPNKPPAKKKSGLSSDMPGPADQLDKYVK
jgi:hypothetical protein